VSLPANLRGLHVIVTSGPTYEPIDPVRFIGNRSSGKQGHAVAAAFADVGARVTLITGPVKITDPAGVTTIHIETADQMLAAAIAALPADVAVCAAAVADWRAKHVAEQKMKKRDGEDELSIALVRNPDILTTLGQDRLRPRIVVGFAAETENVVANARKKLNAKGADLILANNVGGGAVFGADATQLIAVTANNADDWGPLKKLQAAQKIVAAVGTLLKEKQD
jgi:phosphopantothenoylcysteine decarboxylase/phosphopantothenate--cysteine ligase